VENLSMNTSKISNTIQTKRLLLRQTDPADALAALDIYSDDTTMEFWSKEPVRALAEAELLIQEDIKWAASESTCNWAIALPDSNQYIGKISLFQISEQNRRAEIGYLLGRKHWGKGYMTEALSAVLPCAFDELNLHRIEVDTDPENTPSLALLNKFGFVREGLFKDRWFVHGIWHDSVMLALLEKDYRKILANNLS
jgi:ribosomal-protein-alanine N-acetyltransferase